MSETKLKAPPISPVTPQPNSTPTPSLLTPPVRTAHLVNAAAEPGSGLTPKWQGKGARLLRKFRYDETTDALAPFLEEAEELYPAMVEEVCTTAGGRCGPIAQRMLVQSAMISATGMFLLSRAHRHEDPESREAIALARTGTHFAESSSRMMAQALEQAVRIARTAPAVPTDPLGAYLTAPSTEEPQQEPDDEPNP